jgi:hypothetical protein
MTTILDDIARRLRERDVEMSAELTAEQSHRLYEEGIRLEKQLRIRRHEIRQQFMAASDQQNWLETARGSVETSPSRWSRWG